MQGRRWSGVSVVEGLEERRMLAATLSSRGTLVAEGTGGADTVVIGRDPRRTSKILVTINGAGVKFASESVKRIEMYGGAGNDRLTLDDSLGIISARGASLYGGDGNDTLAGGLAGATLDGGNGADSILGSSKADVIMGGAGADTLVGGKGDDLVVGEGDGDVIYGSAGNDMLYGDGGNDTVFGEDGNDTIGGDGEDRFRFKGRGSPAVVTGNDSLVGGNGDDWITGGDESATLHDQNNGADTITGGPGNDVLDARGWSIGSSNPADVITDREAGDVVPMEDYTRPATAAEVKLGEAAYAVHEHAVLYISINDGGVQRDVAIPGGAGDFVDPNVNNTGPRFHTHADRPSVLHMHDLEAGRPFTLGEFFRNWGVTIGANHIGRYVAGGGHTFGVVVRHANGKREALTDPFNYVIKGAVDPAGGDQITITYT